MEQEDPAKKTEETKTGETAGTEGAKKHEKL